MWPLNVAAATVVGRFNTMVAGADGVPRVGYSPFIPLGSMDPNLFNRWPSIALYNLTDALIFSLEGEGLADDDTVWSSMDITGNFAGGTNPRTITYLRANRSSYGLVSDEATWNFDPIPANDWFVDGETYDIVFDSKPASQPVEVGTSTVRATDTGGLFVEDSFQFSVLGDYTPDPNPPIYTDVQLTPPARNNPLIYTTVSQLETENNIAGYNRGRPIKEWTTGISNSPDAWQYIITGDGDRDLVLDFSGDTGHKIEHPIRVDNFQNVFIIGNYMELPIRTQKYAWPTNNYPYPKIPGGMNYRIANTKQLWVEGTHIKNDAGVEPLNGDYFVWRGEYASGADFDNVIVTFQSCLLEGIEGTDEGPAGDTMYHSDYIQNQGSADPLGQWKTLRYENCNLRNGQEGVVWHNWSAGVTAGTQRIWIRNVDFNINADNANQYDRGHGIHMGTSWPFTQAMIDNNQVELENVSYGRGPNDWAAFMNYNASAGSWRYLTDPARAGESSAFYAHPGLTWYDNTSGPPGNQLNTWVEPQNLGGNYVSPHG